MTTYIVTFGPGGDQANPLGGVVKGTFVQGLDNIPKPGSSFTLRGVNAGRNNNGNRGTIAYGWVGGASTEVTWAPDDGANFAIPIEVGQPPEPEPLGE